MKGITEYLKLTGDYAAHQLYWRWKFRGGRPILGRHACLAADVLRLMGSFDKVLNVQKGRIDYLLDCWRNPALRARTLKAAPHLQRKEITDCIIQEEMFYDWRKPVRPTALIMDSMGEHGDQRFVHRRDGWSFLCSYTDLAHTDSFKQDFESAGLLPLEDLEKSFGEFFEKFRTRFGNIPVFYLHFPVKLDERPKFRERYQAIKDTVDGLAGRSSDLFSLAVDESIVDWAEDGPPELKDFPYHYNKRTYEEFVRILRGTGRWPDQQ